MRFILFLQNALFEVNSIVWKWIPMGFDGSISKVVCELKK